MSDYGVKVTTAGKGITSTTVEDYILNSKYSSVKIASIVTGTATYSGGVANVSIEHGLSFIPLVMVFFEWTGGRWFPGQVSVPVSDSDAELGTNHLDVSYSGSELSNTYVDATYVKLGLHGSGSTEYRVIIFADNGD